MRRWLIIAILLLVPVQYSWAAMTAYCKHEQGAAAQHVGHHDHVHVSDDGKAGKDSKKAAGQPDADCGTCHFGHTSGVGAAVEQVRVSVPQAGYLYSVIYRSHIPSRLERPNRLVAG